MPMSESGFKRTAFYREVMQLEGWRHAVALCFWDDPPAAAPIFVTTAYRREGRKGFSSRDVATLERVHPFLECAVSRVYEREAAAIVRDGIAMALQDGAAGLVLVDRDGRLVQTNLLGRELCAAWRDRAAAEGECALVPPEFLAVCRELHHEWQAALRVDPDAGGLRRQRLLHRSVPGLTAWITLVCPNTADLAEPTFVIELDRPKQPPPLGAPDHPMPMLQKMTVAERAVALALADGLSNQEIAERLHKSVDAVKFLLHRIYKKTTIPSRTALVAVLRSRGTELGA
jgi:DNA-binding CsgD family transcriptional regulator